jgi:hypothetical protein
MNSKEGKIAGFTVFEATVVVVIIGILMTIVSVSVNRFNEQLKNTADLNQKLNDFYMVRSGVYTNYYSSDSLACQNNRLVFYRENDSTVYSIDEGKLAIELNNNLKKISLPVEEIGNTEMNGKQYVKMEFIWTPRNLQIRLPRYSFPEQSVNAFFKNING